jgi:PAS domain S-box-containing protein
LTDTSNAELEHALSVERAEHERLAADLHDCEERLRRFAVSSDDPTWDWNLLTGDVDRNNAAAAFFGDNSPLDNRSISWWKEKIHPEDRERVLRTFAEAFASDSTSFSAEYRFIKANGAVAYLYDRGSIIRRADGLPTRAIGTRIDLTELVAGQDALARAQAKHIHAARHSAMGTMASVIAHEVNQPLAAIANYVRAGRQIAAMTDAPVPPEIDSALAAAEENALRAGKIVRRLSELMRQSHVEQRPEQVAALVERACSIAWIDAEASNVQLGVQIADGTPSVLVDPVQIQQVLINLIRNAVEAFEGWDERQIQIEAGRVGQFVEICVSDNGPGIAPAIGDNLFAAQTSTKELGMGIGLSICRTIIEAHGGTIWHAESRVGAEFRFTLPITGEAPTSGS